MTLLLSAYCARSSWVLILLLLASCQHSNWKANYVNASNGNEIELEFLGESVILKSEYGSVALFVNNSDGVNCFYLPGRTICKPPEVWENATNRSTGLIYYDKSRGGDHTVLYKDSVDDDVCTLSSWDRAAYLQSFSLVDCDDMTRVYDTYQRVSNK